MEQNPSAEFLDDLQENVATWTRDIQRVTKWDRDVSRYKVYFVFPCLYPFSGTASQEISFWISLERELLDIDEQLKSEGVGNF